MKIINVEQRLKEIDTELDKVYAEVEKMEKNPIDIKETFDEYMERHRPYDEKIEELSNERRMIMPAELKELSDYGELMTLKSFVKACKSGMFYDYDGFGYYVKDSQQTDIKIYPSDIDRKKYRKDFDTVIWFNK